MKIKSVFSIFIALTLLLSCCGCTLFGNNTTVQVTEEDITRSPEPALNLGVLKNNAATLGLLELMKNAEENETNYNITIAETESEIVKLLDEGKIDCATLPVVSAIRYHNTGKTPIKMLYSASYMTIKMLSTKNDIKSVLDFKNQAIYVPGKNTLEIASLARIINYQQSYYKDSSFTPDFKYTNNSDSLIKAIDSGKVSYCVVAEPTATLIMEKYPDFKLSFEVDEEYKEIRNQKIVQDCVVISNEYLRDNPEAVETLMTRCKTSIVYSNYNAYSAAKLAELYQIAENTDIALKMIQNSNLSFVDASVSENNNRYIFATTYSLIVDTDILAGYLPESSFYYS